MKKLLLMVGALMSVSAPVWAQRTVLDEAEWTDAKGTHNFQGEGYDYATNGDVWVNTKGGETWFSYDLSLESVDAGRPLYLACLFNNSDYKDRETLIYANDIPVAEPLARPAQGRSGRSQAHLLLPAVCWMNEDGTVKDKVTVRIEGVGSKYSMGFCGVALVQSSDYEFKCTDWVTGDGKRLSPDNLDYDETGNVLKVIKRNDGNTTNNNNVALSMDKEKDNLYTVPASHKYFVVCGTSLDTSASGLSSIWWFNGRNVNSSEAPLFQTTLENGTSYVVWDITKTRLADNFVSNPVTLTSYNEAFNFCFGLTSSAEDGSAQISDINFYSLTGIAEKYPELAEAMRVTLLDENAGEETVTLDDYVGMKRVLKPFVWNTFCVPFDLDAAWLKANGFMDVKELSAVRPGKETTVLTFNSVETVEAGKPYLVKVNDNIKELNVDAPEGVQSAPRSQSAMEGVMMVGNYGKTTIADGEFFISNNMFYCADREVTVKGFRAYIKNVTGAEVNRMLIDTDGFVTAVDKVVEGLTVDAPVNVYTLSGVCVKKGVPESEALEGLPKGIYLVNGRKLMK